MLKWLEKILARLRPAKKEVRTEYYQQKIVFVQLRNSRGNEICCGGVIKNDDGLGKANFAELQDVARQNCVNAFRLTLSDKKSSVAGKSDKEVMAAIDGLIAMEGYFLKWFYSGWVDTPPEDAQGKE